MLHFRYRVVLASVISILSDIVRYCPTCPRRRWAPSVAGDGESGRNRAGISSFLLSFQSGWIREHRFNKVHFQIIMKKKTKKTRELCVIAPVANIDAQLDSQLPVANFSTQFHSTKQSLHSKKSAAAAAAAAATKLRSCRKVVLRFYFQSRGLMHLTSVDILYQHWHRVPLVMADTRPNQANSGTISQWPDSKRAFQQSSFKKKKVFQVWNGISLQITR